jgi:hypothetical protein
MVGDVRKSIMCDVRRAEVDKGFTLQVPVVPGVVGDVLN